ncbi:MAG: SPOR domain-containing protein [Brumimicrobium sp.]|nr:SPOR domain-containing protein [Brumimicrobium sp.]
MNLRLIILLLLAHAGTLFGQREEVEIFLHKPCFNDSISVFSAEKLGLDLILSVHDLPSMDSIPGRATRSVLVRYSDSCVLQDAMLYQKERQEYMTLNVATNTGPVSLSKDETLLFLSNTYVGVSKDKMGIYVLYNDGNGWLIQQEFPFNSDQYSVMHPAYDQDKGRLYFSSDKGSDFFNLWYAEFDGQQFGDSIYRLDALNAPNANDVFPSVNKGKLNFSSDRKKINFLGIYEAELMGDKWRYRESPDSTFISIYDDFALNMVSDRTGVFASTRDTDGKKDELFMFRKGVDCALFPKLAHQRFVDDTDTELKEALAVIDEFKNVFGTESELTYNLNVDYIREEMNKNRMTVADFYCNLFNYIDSTSLYVMDQSMESSIKTEKLVDSIFSVVRNDLKQEIIVDSLIKIIEKRYAEVGVDLEIAEQKEILMETYAPLKALADSLVEFSDTLRKALIQRLEGLRIEKDKLPDFAQQPNGLFFAVQLGAYSNKAGPDYFSNIDEVIEVSGPTGLYHYITGYCNSIDAALKAQAQVRGVGYPDAFIVAYCDGERIPLFKAKELLASGECEPLSESREPNIDYSVVVNRPGTDKPFTVKVDPNYNKAAGAAVAIASETREGLFYTVQVGVFDKPVSSGEIQNLPNLITTLLPNGQIRYSTGHYQSESEAQDAISEAVSKGFSDAFVTAYYKGERIPLYQAKELLDKKGKGVLEKF